jgi:hypothetical protein
MHFPDIGPIENRIGRGPCRTPRRILGRVSRHKRTTPAAAIGHGAVVGVTDAVGDAAIPACASQTTPAFVK